MLRFSEKKYKDKLLLNGLTSKSVAEAVNIAPASLSRIIKHKQNVSPETIAKISEVLKCTPADLLEEV